MATRYSGTLTLKIQYRAKTEDYRVQITEVNDDARFATLTGLRLSVHDQRHCAVDSAYAYDRAAQAALSFAAYDDETIHAYASCDESGEFAVRRCR